MLATLLRLRGDSAAEAVARLGYYVAFPTMLVCPILLTLDLGQPLRFWHMLVNTTPGQLAPIFKYWSPMSVGAWALVAFGLFVTVSFLDALRRDRRGIEGAGLLAKLWSIAGAVVGLFIAGYTGVLLAVSNQPVWSDTWALGGLFLASGLSGSAALLGWLARHRRAAQPAAGAFVRAERVFLLLELVLIVAFVLTLVPAGTLGRLPVDPALGARTAVRPAVVAQPGTHPVRGRRRRYRGRAGPGRRGARSHPDHARTHQRPGDPGGGDLQRPVTALVTKPRTRVPLVRGTRVRGFTGQVR